MDSGEDPPCFFWQTMTVSSGIEGLLIICSITYFWSSWPDLPLAVPRQEENLEL